MFVLRPAKRIPDNNVLFTRRGRKIKVTAANSLWIIGTIKKKEYTWFDTGNYLGSDCPHYLDIDWKHSWFNFKRWKQRKKRETRKCMVS